MIRFHQTRLAALCLKIMTLRAWLTLGRVIFYQLSILVHMMAYIAFIDLGHFIVMIMLKSNRRPPRMVKNTVIKDNKILLRIGDRKGKNTNRYE